MSSPVVLANVVRGKTVESVHRGHLMVIDGERNPIVSLGDPSAITYFRSAAKAFQALPAIISGAADRFGFTEDEIAMACSSHSGEAMHVERSARMLDKIGLSESDLRCGVHLPFNEKESERMLRAGETPSQLHNNCSGKHSAMLAFAKHIGADIGAYDSTESPIQKAILKCVADFAELNVDEIAIGIDGCAAPNFAVPIAAMAVSFMNLISPARFDEPTRNACSRVVSAMLKYPELIGGSTRLDTMLMQAAAGRIISKVGADGVWLCGILPCEQWPTGLSISMKVSDGDDHRARPVAAAQILRKLGILAAEALPELSPMPITNRRGDSVGRVEAVVGDLF